MTVQVNDSNDKIGCNQIIKKVTSLIVIILYYEDLFRYTYTYTYYIIKPCQDTLRK